MNTKVTAKGRLPQGMQNFVKEFRDTVNDFVLHCVLSKHDCENNYDGVRSLYQDLCKKMDSHRNYSSKLVISTSFEVVPYESKFAGIVYQGDRAMISITLESWKIGGYEPQTKKTWLVQVDISG